ncbi:hypothetical protein V8G54_031672 [Vigna mungo]|uniref:Wax synthase domain-containing protein n=1 Tax=Vigna mungo TaxID=3915 RepID=A0AAQ3MKK7_VIGMU
MKETENEIEKFMKVWISAMLGLCYCYYIASRIPKGFFRLLSLIPILYLFITLPFKISSPNLVAYTSFFLVWLATFKLLLFSFNQGPLALSPSNILHFISIASLPINPTQHPNTTQKLPKWLLALKVLTLGIIVHVSSYIQYMNPHFISLLYYCYLYLGLEIVLAFITFTVQNVFGFQIEPLFNKPYLCTSLQDFWGRRWSLMITRILRPTVYNPLRRIFTDVFNPTHATSVAMLATFLVSGLMHELMYYYLTRASPTWEVTCFFILHGVCTTVEVAVKKVALRRGWRLQHAMSRPLVMVFLVSTCWWLFLPQLLRNGVHKKATQECEILVNFVVHSRLPYIYVCL